MSTTIAPNDSPATSSEASRSSAGRIAASRLADNALTVLQRRYLVKDATGKAIEEPDDLFWRVAQNIAEADAAYGATPEQVSARAEEFYSAMASLDFLPNSPTLMNAGRGLQQLSACFVLPIEDQMEKIFETVKNTALIHQSGGGTGFSFSRLRPEGDVVGSTMGTASGPVSFMSVFNSATETIKQGGTRRGANMAVLRVDHPDILKFIECKSDLTQLTNFNISVAITDEFMRCAREDCEYDLINPRTKQVVGQLDAKEVYRRIVQAAWESGEPGVIFIDRINAYNPTPALGDIESTNPCGEQPLLPYESCNLGSINLAQMTVGEVMRAEVDWERIARAVHTAVRFLDNVIDQNRFPLPEIEEMTRGNRKIGLGVMGFADMLIQLGIPYNSEQAVQMARQIMQTVRDEARVASRELAVERGTFPKFEQSIFPRLNGAFKLRNATTTTIAPTGTISIIAGVSSGIEPLFAVAFSRHVMDGDELVEVNPLFEQVARARGFYSPDLIKEIAARGTLHEVPGIPSDVTHVFTVAHDISPAWHTRLQAAFQEFTDNAVSKTVNFGNDATVEDVATVYNLAYDLGCKGVTIYRDGSRDLQVLRTGKNEAKKTDDSAAAVAYTAEPQARPDVVHGVTRMMSTGCGKLYITVNCDEDGPFEIFGNMGKAGGCAASQTEALARLASLSFRCGIDAEHVIKQLRGISCHMPAWQQGGGKILSCADAFAKAIEACVHPEGAQLAIDFNGKSFGHAGACPDCGGTLHHEEGCIKCHDCGYSQCD